MENSGHVCVCGMAPMNADCPSIILPTGEDLEGSSWRRLFPVWLWTSVGHPLTMYGKNLPFTPL